MYIEDRLFSENSGEVLYSVLLTEDECRIYADVVEQAAEQVANNIKDPEKIGLLKRVGNRIARAWGEGGIKGGWKQNWKGRSALIGVPTAALATGVGVAMARKKKKNQE